MTLFLSHIPKDCLTEPLFKEYRSLPSSEGLQKNKNKLQSGTPKKNWVGGANFKKGHFFGQKHTLTNPILALEKVFTRRRRLKGIHSRSDTNRTGAEGLSFYYPRLLHCLDQMLAVMSLSQHRVSSSKTVRPRAPCGARCIGHAVSTWSAVCSKASN